MKVIQILRQNNYEGDIFFIIVNLIRIDASDKNTFEHKYEEFQFCSVGYLGNKITLPKLKWINFLFGLAGLNFALHYLQL